MDLKKLIQAACLTGIALAVISCNNGQKQKSADALLLQDVTLINGNGAEPQLHTDILIQGDSIAAIGQNLDTTNVKTINLDGNPASDIKQTRSIYAVYKAGKEVSKGPLK